MDDTAANVSNDDSDRCCLHDNLFEILYTFDKLSKELQLALVDYISKYIPSRHAIHMLFRELCNDQSKSTDHHDDESHRTKKRRKVYRLVNSSSDRSVAKVYNSYWRFLLEYSDGCCVYNGRDDIRHKYHGVHTNFANGGTVDMLDFDERPNEAMDGLWYEEYEQNNSETTDASRTVHVHTALRYPLEITQSVLEDQTQLESAAPSDRENLARVIAYVEQPIHQKAIKLLDFVFLTGAECWSLWTDVLNRSINVHQQWRLYPIKDSIYDLWMVRANNEQMDRLFPDESIFVGVSGPGLLIKLGGLIDFTVSFRQLLRFTMLSGCYGIERQAHDRMNYTQRHQCCLPAASQGVYQEVFRTSKFGHDLLCTLPISSRHDCLRWLRTFDEIRETVRRTSESENDEVVLQRHLAETYGTDTVGGFTIPATTKRNTK